MFEQAIAQASWTKPSIASIFTSLLPGRHRVVQLRDPARPEPHDARGDAGRQGPRDRRRGRQLRDLPGRPQLRPGLRLLRGRSRRGRQAFEGPEGEGRRGRGACAGSTSAPASPPSCTSTRWTRTFRTRRRRPSTGCSSRIRCPTGPRPTRATTTRRAPIASGWSRSTTATSPTTTSSSAASSPSSRRVASTTARS